MPFIETEARYENTIMREIRNSDGVLNGYDIAPAEGYVLHNNSFDEYEYKYDPESEEQEEPLQGELISKGYSPSSSGVSADYDFDTNPSEIYAKKRDELEENEVVH